MNKWQQYVGEFISCMGMEENKTPGEWSSEKQKQLCLKLIDEEVNKELIPALEEDDLVEAVDGACDSIWVILFAMESLGIDLKPFYEEVRDTNMSKVGGKKDPVTGKHLKPEGWQPPRIKGILEYKGIKV